MGAIRVLLLLVITLIDTSCSKTATYGYQRDFHVAFPEDYAPTPMSAAARDVLASARSVAFAPPDYCSEPDDRRRGVQVEEGLLRMECGVIVSSLERSAEEAGFRVVSFRTLRGNSRPIEYAKQSGVDVLFEINELAFDRILDRDTRTDLSFFEETPSGTRSVAASRSVAERCAALVKSRPPVVVALSGTIDIKMIRVSDGQNLWHYRRTRGARFDESSSQTFRKTKATPTGPRFIGIGAAMVVSGLVMANMNCFDNDPECGDVLNKSGKLVAFVGTVMTGAGLIVMAAETPPSVDEVLCRVPAAGGGSDTADGPSEAASSSTYSFSEHVESSDTHSEDRKKLRTAIIEDFLMAMSDVSHTEGARPPDAVPEARPH